MPIRYRDGLIIALLIACPVRIKNLANLVIGQHLVFDGDAYRLKLSAAETKAGRPYLGSVPPELTPYIDGWLQVRRPSLQLNAARRGRPALESPLAGSLRSAHAERGDPAAD